MKKCFPIKNKTWSLITVPDNSDKIVMDGQKCCAQIFFRTREIFINEEIIQDYDTFKETVLHELTHAFIFSYGLDNNSFQEEEFICEFIAIYAEDIVRISKDIISFFVK